MTRPPAPVDGLILACVLLVVLCVALVAVLNMYDNSHRTLERARFEEVCRKELSLALCRELSATR